MRRNATLSLGRPWDFDYPEAESTSRRLALPMSPEGVGIGLPRLTKSFAINYRNYRLFPGNSAASPEENFVGFGLCKVGIASVPVSGKTHLTRVC